MAKKTTTKKKVAKKKVAKKTTGKPRKKSTRQKTPAKKRGRAPVIRDHELVQVWARIPPELNAHIQAFATEHKRTKAQEIYSILETHVKHVMDLERLREETRKLETTANP